MDVFKERILPLLMQTGKSDQKLESEIGLPAKILYDWKSGRSKSYKKYCGAIASYFHVSSDYLLGNTDDPRLPEEISAEKEKSPTLQVESEVDKELLDIWANASPEDRQLLLDMARAIKNRRESK